MKDHVICPARPTLDSQFNAVEGLYFVLMRGKRIAVMAHNTQEAIILSSNHMDDEQGAVERERIESGMRLWWPAPRLLCPDIIAGYSMERAYKQAMMGSYPSDLEYPTVEVRDLLHTRRLLATEYDRLQEEFNRLGSTARNAGTVLRKLREFDKQNPDIKHLYWMVYDDE